MSRRSVLQTAAAVAATAAGDVADSELSAQETRLAQLADRDDADRWSYNTEASLAHVRTRMMSGELDQLCDEPDGVLQTHPISSKGIPVGFEVATDAEESIGTLVHLSADQAEALAVDLLEQAHSAREEDNA